MKSRTAAVVVVLAALLAPFINTGQADAGEICWYTVSGGGVSGDCVQISLLCEDWGMSDGGTSYDESGSFSCSNLVAPTTPGATLATMPVGR